MSIRIMAAIFESKTLGPVERLVMLALADHADDEGRCYPSIARLQARTGLGERAVQSNIRKLAQEGYLTISEGGGRGRPNLYVVRANPAAETPFEMHPAAETPFLTTERVHLTTVNPAADAPEPLLTIKEPKKETRADARAILLPVLGDELTGDFIDHRRAIKAPLTPKAAKLIVERLSGCADPQEAVRRSIMNGWRGVFPQPQLSASKGGRNDRERFDVAHAEYVRRVREGRIDRGPDPSDPFAG